MQQSGGGGGDPTESLSPLAFGNGTWTYTDAALRTTGSWNVATNFP